jgi:hypothetical protein
LEGGILIEAKKVLWQGLSVEEIKRTLEIFELQQKVASDLNNKLEVYSYHFFTSEMREWLHIKGIVYKEGLCVGCGLCNTIVT